MPILTAPYPRGGVAPVPLDHTAGGCTPYGSLPRRQGDFPFPGEFVFMCLVVFVPAGYIGSAFQDQAHDILISPALASQCQGLACLVAREEPAVAAQRPGWQHSCCNRFSIVLDFAGPFRQWKHSCSSHTPCVAHPFWVGSLALTVHCPVFP